MSDLPGNPHAAALTAHRDRGNTLSPTVEASLALAYEQRTANLIAMQAMGVTDLTDWHPTHSEAWIERAREIETRLGSSDDV